MLGYTRPVNLGLVSSISSGFSRDSHYSPVGVMPAIARSDVRSVTKKSDASWERKHLA
ncbi:MAG: hypothetical protein JWR69_3503 [Pedosphaera sp.]|nr:hypothetical protein [Pedosphaera sp.]